MLGEVGRDRTVARQPPNSGDVLPTNEELREAELPLSHHWQSGKAAEDDEDSRNPKGQQWTLPGCYGARRCEGTGQGAQSIQPK